MVASEDTHFSAEEDSDPSLAAEAVGEGTSPSVCVGGSTACSAVGALVGDMVSITALAEIFDKVKAPETVEPSPPAPSMLISNETVSYTHLPSPRD